MSWRTLTVEEVCTQVSSGGTPKRTKTEYWENGTIPWLKTGELNDGYVSDAEERITQEGLRCSSAKIFPRDTVLMAMYGDGRTITTLAVLGEPCSTNQACAAMIADPEICNSRFLFYCMKQHRHKLLGLVVAGAQRNLSLGIIKKFPLLLPELATQERIAGILSAYDDLIENNRRRIALLEQAARLLYREWFVHFRFPGHETATFTDGLPEGWSECSFSGMAEYLNGFAFKPRHLGDHGLPIVKIPELKGGILNKTPRYGGRDVPDKYLLCDGDLLFSWSGTLAVDFWNSGPAYLNQHLFKVTPREKFSRAFILIAVRECMPKFMGKAVGATMKHIRRSALDQVMHPLPPEEIFSNFNERVTEIYEQVQNLRAQNKKLADARDLLLPRLMDGRIPVDV